MRKRLRWRAGFGVVALVVVVAVLPPRVAVYFYRMTNSQRSFNYAVSRAIPKGATLEQLEDLVGQGTRTSLPPWMKRQILRNPKDFPDGWRQGDEAISYAFPGRSRWYFQVRGGRLVNYDPDVLAGQPQENLVTIR